MYSMHVRKGALEAPRTHFRAHKISIFSGGVPPDPPHKMYTVKALIKVPLKYNYDPQRCLVRSEKKLLQTLRDAMFRETPSN